MSSIGRKPKPTAVKRLAGNPGKRRLNTAEPRPATRARKPRGWHGGLAERFWDEHAGELERLGILTGVDAPAFRLMAEAYAFAVEAAATLRHDGFTVEGRDGLKTHPVARAFRDNATLFKGLAGEFGMTPSARSRLTLPPDAEQLSLADKLFAAAAQMQDADGD